MDKVNIPEPIDKRAKDMCCLCFKPIKKKLYKKFGNYCQKCSATCVQLSTLIHRKNRTKEYEEESDKFIKSLPLGKPV